MKKETKKVAKKQVKKAIKKKDTKKAIKKVKKETKKAVKKINNKTAVAKKQNKLTNKRVDILDEDGNKIGEAFEKTGKIGNKNVSVKGAKAEINKNGMHSSMTSKSIVITADNFDEECCKGIDLPELDEEVKLKSGYNRSLSDIMDEVEEGCNCDNCDGHCEEDYYDYTPENEREDYNSDDIIDIDKDEE